MTKAQRIKTMREMADRLRYVCEVNSIYRITEMEDFIKGEERKHRRGYGGGRRYAASVPVAVDYFLVRCFADAFKVLRSAETVDDWRRRLCVRTDYLLALAIVADYEAVITSSVHVGELMAARDLVDYCADIAGGA